MSPLHPNQRSLAAPPPCCLPLCFANPQGRLNQIDVVVNLKMHQIEYLVDGRLPTDLTQGLVFSDKELEKLKRRIEVRGWTG